MLERFLPKGSMIRRLTLLASGTTLSQLILILATPLLTRLFTPEDFGIFTIFTTFMSVISVGACLRYEAAIPLCREEEVAVHGLSLCLATAFLIGGLTAIALFFFSDEIGAATKLGDQANLLWWLPPAIILSGIFLAFDGWALRAGHLRDVITGRLISSLVLVALQLGLGLWGLEAKALVIGFTLAQAPLFMPALFRLWRGPPTTRPHMAGMLSLAKAQKSFPLYALPATVIGQATVMIPPVILAIIYGPLVAGLYGLAQRVAGLPIRFIATSAHQLFVSESAKLGADQHNELLTLFVGLVKKLSTIGALCVGAIAVASPLLFAPVFGGEWQESGIIVALLAPMYLAMFIGFSVKHSLNILGRQDLILKLDLFRLALVLASFAIAYGFELDHRTCIILYSLSMLIYFALYIGLAWKMLRARALTPA